MGQSEHGISEGPLFRSLFGLFGQTLHSAFFFKFSAKYYIRLFDNWPLYFFAIFLQPFLVYFYNKPMYTLFFAIKIRMNVPRPKWTTYKHVSDNSKKCLSVVCVLAPAYISLCRGLKYLLKVKYIILVDPLRARFLIYETVLLGSSATLPYF